mgnify:CR=1 FL=1
MQQNPLFAFLAKGQLSGSSGIKLTPGLNNNHQFNNVKKFIKHSKDMSQITDNPFSKLKEELGTSTPKGKKDYTGKDC